MNLTQTVDYALSDAERQIRLAEHTLENELRSYARKLTMTADHIAKGDFGGVNDRGEDQGRGANIDRLIAIVAERRGALATLREVKKYATE